jgi:glycosyltransferase involved in cell wall biosynthesis
VASYGDLCTARQRIPHGGRIVLMQHGAGQSYGDRHPHYPGGDDNEAVGLFLTPGESAAQRWRDRYPTTPAVAIGSPRVELLPRREPGPVTVAITFHWDLAHWPETTSAYPYFSTALGQLRDSFHLIGHAHPRARNLPRVYQRADIEYVASFEDVCRRADVLIADNTSALFEFAATGRPVVVMNSPEYRREARFGLRFWDAAEVGINVDHPADLVRATRQALRDTDDRRAHRDAALDLVYAYRTGAAERAERAIRAWSSATFASTTEAYA